MVMKVAIAANGVAESGTTAVPKVDVHETHTGVVVLVGDRAFKAKKPVLTDFLDFRTLEQRERACFREVELNSRLSPDSYLGVASWASQQQSCSPCCWYTRPSCTRCSAPPRCRPTNSCW
jgi:aminoglycoside phosphotransferase family enzyme